jgi:hypothetical protein
MSDASMYIAPTRNSFSPPSSSRLSCNCYSSCHLHNYAILIRKNLQVFFVQMSVKKHITSCVCKFLRVQVSMCASFHKNTASRTLVCANVHENIANQHWTFSFIFAFCMMVCWWGWLYVLNSINFGGCHLALYN